MPFADVATGAQLHYIDTGGDKPILLLIHGRLEIPERDLAGVIDWLKPDFRVIAPNLRGYGQSTPKPRRYPMDFYEVDARDVLALMDALGIQEAHIVGYSDGGETALLAAGLQPERFKSVVSWGAVGYFGPAMRPVAQRSYPPTWISEEDIQLHTIPDPNGMALEWVTATKAMIDSGGNVSVQYAQNITCPLLLMLGEQDLLNPAEYGQRFVDKTKQGRLVTFKCGHAIHEQAWEEFQRVVGQFLASVK